MTELYLFLMGPGLIIALGICIFGLAARLVLYFMGLDWRLDRVSYKYYFRQGMIGGLHSILKWLIPFGSQGWKTQPVVTLYFFLLHCGAVLLPFFLLGHTEVLRMKFGIHLPALPMVVADALTIATILGICGLTLRRITLPHVSILTTGQDYLILALVFVPFITGFAARMEMGTVEVWTLLHIASAELLLILAPFTKLSHIVLFFASRWQIGADYAIKRGGGKRGPCFPW